MTRTDLKDYGPILVSACLLGIYCRYDGRCETDERVMALSEGHVLIPVCPEQLGGLPTPRSAVELLDGRAVTRDGADLTEAFERGVLQVERVARLTGARAAVLQPRSPSCGRDIIYDGTFSGRRIEGDGALTQYLRAQGFLLLVPDELD
ncbi:Uncharacterized conserved protein YbbK, DUF523 family [Desulfomicrobium norvegicum]|uniref:Uncharacterized conserved protein YbbK, DUF523 family n=1 Tax=Desulfomicrobium norvegicum (strain DSM 1741 / NCIMB 8310) TaxID=52561 RepID=A0A8G2C5I3_DESNO|nr:DUF523 domain-containing protein [Desulfomicrobium norvegicum]SFM12220.1 Uncharacterized conserved protein YbbK, DUF523 family [Desulfomicrobium norvegicum]